MLKTILNYLKTKVLNIIIDPSKNYNDLLATNLLFTELAKRLNRRKCEIYFSDHAARDKNLDREDSENAIKTVQFGKIDEYKSNEAKERICFKNYFNKKNKTYFVVVEYYSDSIKIITVIKEKGKY